MPVDGKIVGNATIWDYKPSELFYTPSFLTSKIYPYETIDTLDVESEITYLKESIVQRDTMDLSVALDVFTVRAPTYGTYDLPVDILTPSIALAAFSVRTVIYIPYTEDDDVNIGSIQILASTGRTKLGPLHYY